VLLLWQFLWGRGPQQHQSHGRVSGQLHLCCPAACQQQRQEQPSRSAGVLEKQRGLVLVQQQKQDMASVCEQHLQLQPRSSMSSTARQLLQSGSLWARWAQCCSSSGRTV
jgi:hypothetical protein